MKARLHGEYGFGIVIGPRKLGLDRALSLGVGADGVVGGAGDAIRRFPEQPQTFRLALLQDQPSVEVGSQVLNEEDRPLDFE